jgi:hypothetical protein
MNDSDIHRLLLSTRVLVLTRTAKVQFRFSYVIPSRYDIFIKVNTFKNPYTKHEYFEVMYGYKFYPPPPEYITNAEELLSMKTDLHPIHYSPEQTEEPASPYPGMAVKNEFSTRLVEFLLMDNDSLSEVSGEMSPDKYRKNIMHSLSYFTQD